MMVPSVAKSEAVQAWLKEEGMVGSIKEKERERERRVLLFAAQQLHSQGDAFMPRPRQDADESCVEGGLEHVIFVHVVVTVARENLQVKQKKKDRVRQGHDRRIEEKKQNIHEMNGQHCGQLKRCGGRSESVKRTFYRRHVVPNLKDLLYSVEHGRCFFFF